MHITLINMSTGNRGGPVQFRWSRLFNFGMRQCLSSWLERFDGRLKLCTETFSLTGAPWVLSLSCWRSQHDCNRTIFIHAFKWVLFTDFFFKSHWVAFHYCAKYVLHNQDALKSALGKSIFSAKLGGTIRCPSRRAYSVFEKDERQTPIQYLLSIP